MVFVAIIKPEYLRQKIKATINVKVEENCAYGHM